MLPVGAIDTPDKARQELLPTRHIDNIEIQSTLPTFNNELFQAQVEAIQLLGKVGDADDIKLLIPFLDYPGEGAYNYFGVIPPDLEYIKLHWPAFAAISGIPRSTEALMIYGADKNNPVDYRLTVFLMLKYLSPDTFTQCIDEVREKEAANTQLLEYIDLLQKRQYIFRGIVHHAILDHALEYK